MVNYLLDLTELDGKNGFVVSGLDDGDRLGTAVSNAGDLNGDGFDDLILTAPFAAESITNSQQIYPNDRGEAFIIFGSNTFVNNLDLNTLDGSNGFVVRGLNNDARLSEAVSSAGDINGDGFDDLIIGAAYGGKTRRYPNKICYSCAYDYRGEVYTIFGSNEGFAANLDLNSLDGSNGFVIKGLGNNDRLGKAVSNAGDLNGDGLDDLILGAPFASVSDENSQEGEVYVVFGSNKGFAADFNLASLDGSNGFVVRGLDKPDYLGKAVSNAGDINSDGLDDFIISASYAEGAYRGEAYVIFGRKSGFAANLDLNSLDGSNGFVIQDVDGDADALLGLGNAVSNAGDINGDGFDDLIIGASDASISTDNSQEGEVYVVFGSDRGFTAKLDLNTLDGSNGFVVRGLNNGDRLGTAISSAGDINHDGFDDLIIGAPFAEADDRYSGEVYVIFGSDRSFTPVFDLSNLSSNEGLAIQVLDPTVSLGSAVSNAGDVNGDGLDDLILGAPSASVGDRYNSQGQAYIIFDLQSAISKRTNSELEAKDSTVYRFFNSSEGVHFYTADEVERNYVRDNLDNYVFEGESYITVDPVTGNSPEAVYRFFNSTTGVHLYTTDENERDYIIDNLSNFAYEDVKFYAYETEVKGSVPVYRFYEPTIGVHFYTPNQVEKTYVEENLLNYNYEGIAYYAFPINNTETI